MNLRLKTSDLKKLFYLIQAVILTLSCFQYSYSQNVITSNDEIIIKQKALELIKNLEFKYNQLLESDSNGRSLIIDDITNSKSNIFVNDQLIIEDDFLTRTNMSNETPTKKIDVYFKEIGSSYGKIDNEKNINEGKNIRFSNIFSSSIMAVSPQAPMFINVFFEVNYNGIDNRTGFTFRQPCKRVAEISILKNNNSWVLSINALRFSKISEVDFSKNVKVEKAKNITDFPKPKEAVSKINNKSLIVKVGLGILGIGTGIYALKLNNNWNSKLSEIEKASLSGNYASYLTAYDSASQFQSSQGLRNLCVGIAVTSAISEVYMFIRKPKKQKTSILPSNNSIGLTLNYKF